ncbi:hypothetical protein AAG570_009452 [Ranatra chinensis]|uniref:Uncharacterized protein n=1 Tax=Ranatra chinensis TaxID=642074 RepID=A0ABD0YP67_9HEMI
MHMCVSGCLFSEELCTPGVDWCYDDGAFGRCIVLNGDADADDLHRYEFEKEELESLESEIEKLMLDGYKWSHRRTQCIVQTLLYSFRSGNAFNRLLCDIMKPDESENQQRELEEPSQRPINVFDIIGSPALSLSIFSADIEVTTLVVNIPSLVLAPSELRHISSERHLKSSGEDNIDRVEKLRMFLFNEVFLNRGLK